MWVMCTELLSDHDWELNGYNCRFNLVVAWISIVISLIDSCHFLFLSGSIFLVSCNSGPCCLFCKDLEHMQRQNSKCRLYRFSCMMIDNFKWWELVTGIGCKRRSVWEIHLPSLPHNCHKPSLYLASSYLSSFISFPDSLISDHFSLRAWWLISLLLVDIVHFVYVWNFDACDLCYFYFENVRACLCLVNNPQVTTIVMLCAGCK